jgi:hypothetical protein
MWHVWERREMGTGLAGKLKEGDLLEDLAVIGKMGWV